MIINYKNNGMELNNPRHDELLTDFVKAIRKDLNIKDKNFPNIYIKVARKKT